MKEDTKSTDKRQGKKRRINIYKQFNGSWVPEWLMERKEIGNGAKLAYSRLARYAGKNGKCFPKVSELARAIGVSTKTARKYINELVGVGLIEKERPGQGLNNEYFFLEHEWMNTTVPDRNTSTDLERNTPADPSYIKENNNKREGSPSHFLKDLVEEFVKDCEAGKKDQYTDAEYLALLTYHILKANSDVARSPAYKNAKLEKWTEDIQKLLSNGYSKDEIQKCIRFSTSDPFHYGNIKNTEYIEKNIATLNSQRKAQAKKEAEKLGIQETYKAPKPHTEWYELAENDKGHVLFFRDQGYMGCSLFLYQREPKKCLGGDLTDKSIKELLDNPKEIEAAFEYVYGVIEQQKEREPVGAA